MEAKPYALKSLNQKKNNIVIQKADKGNDAVSFDKKTTKMKKKPNFEFD